MFKLFEDNGEFEMLDRDYEILHCFGFEYIFNDIDELVYGDKA